jgi:hypothetical protein
MKFVAKVASRAVPCRRQTCNMIDPPRFQADLTQVLDNSAFRDRRVSLQLDTSIIGSSCSIVLYQAWLPRIPATCPTLPAGCPEARRPFLSPRPTKILSALGQVHRSPPSPRFELSLNKPLIPF